MDDDSRAQPDSADDNRRHSELDQGESGEGGDKRLSPPVPFAPDKDDKSPLGDSDQHSDA
jgi:hypothetical protein